MPVVLLSPERSTGARSTHLAVHRGSAWWVRACSDPTTLTTAVALPPAASRQMTRGVSPRAQRGAWSLRFDDEALERRFRHAFDAAAAPLVRAGTSLAIALTIAFGLVDVWLVGDAVLPALILHGVVVATLAGCLWAQHRPWWVAVQRFVGPAAVGLAAFAFDAAAIASPMPAGFAAPTTMAAIVFVCTLLRTTVGIAAGGSGVMVAGYVASAIVNREELH